MATSGNPYFANDNRIDSLTLGYSWSASPNTSTTINYSLTTATSGAAFSSAAQAAALSALQKWSNVANITLNDAGGAATFTFAFVDQGSMGDAQAANVYGQSNANSLDGTQIQFDDSFSSNSFAEGSRAYMLLLHEIGHGLGLKHPGSYGGFDTGPFLPSNADNNAASVMSYNWILPTLPTGPMIYDILAMQYLYGANTSYQSGNTTYSYNGIAPLAECLWDGGGTDRLDASAFAGASTTLNLNAGLTTFSTIGKQRVWVAFDANIENATGSNGRDTITGNDLDNELIGNNGVDILHGGAGDDTLYGDTTNLASTVGGGDRLNGNDGDDALYGGAGRDSLYGGADNDTLYGNLGDDLLYGEAGEDSLYGGVGKDTLNGGTDGDQLFGEEGDDRLNGDAGDDVLSGGIGKDTLSGGADADTLNGGDSDDRLNGDAGNDQLNGDAGKDTLYGGDGDDLLFGNSEDDRLFGDSGSDGLYGGAGNDSLSGGVDGDILVGGAGNDTLVGGTGNDIFEFDSGSGLDRITDFSGAGVAGGDVLLIHANVNGSGITSIAQVLAAITYTGSGAVLNLTGGNMVTLVGVKTTLTYDDIQII